MSRSAVGPGLLLALWSPFSVSQLPEIGQSPQLLLHDVGALPSAAGIGNRARPEGLVAYFLIDASLTWQLEQFFRSDPVDLAWAEATERSLAESLNTLGLDFRQLRVTCKTDICKVESEIRYGSFIAENMTLRYSDTYRDIAQRGIGSLFRPDGSPLGRISGMPGAVTVHYVYSDAVELESALFRAGPQP